jgi:hypothetical protein
MRTAALIILVLVTSSATAYGERYASGNQVVHDRRAPVVAHRLVPPFRGQHVYQGRAGRR